MVSFNCHCYSCSVNTCKMEDPVLHVYIHRAAMLLLGLGLNCNLRCISLMSISRSAIFGILVLTKPFPHPEYDPLSQGIPFGISLSYSFIVRPSVNTRASLPIHSLRFLSKFNTHAILLVILLL